MIWVCFISGFGELGFQSILFDFEKFGFFQFLGLGFGELGSEGFD